MKQDVKYNAFNDTLKYNVCTDKRICYLLYGKFSTTDFFRCHLGIFIK